MIIVMGLPGSGKSSVLKGLKTDYKILNYGDLMFDIEKEKFGIKDRDEMRTIPIEKQKEVQKLVSARLATMEPSAPSSPEAKLPKKEDGKLILDTHCAVNTPRGFYPGLPFEFLKHLKVDALVYITADVAEIIARRANDPTRKRDNDDLATHQRMSECYLAAYSAFTGAPATIIFNRQGKLEEAVAKLQGLLK